MNGNDLVRLGQLIYDSHDSLQHDYDVTCAETDFLVDRTRSKDYILGARQMGGGFGGCTINLIHKDYAEDFIKQIDSDYQQQFDQSISPYLVDIVGGASVVFKQ